MIDPFGGLAEAPALDPFGGFGDVDPLGAPPRPDTPLRHVTGTPGDPDFKASWDALLSRMCEGFIPSTYNAVFICRECGPVWLHTSDLPTSARVMFPPYVDGVGGEWRGRVVEIYPPWVLPACVWCNVRERGFSIPRPTVRDMIDNQGRAAFGRPVRKGT